MGGWKASGLGSRHGPDGIRKYTRRQSLLITPGYAPSREAHMLPYSAAVTVQIGQAISALAASEMFTDAQRRTLSVLCDTMSRRSSRRPASATRTASGLGPPRTSGSVRRSSSPCSDRARLPTRSRAFGSCSIRSPSRGSRPRRRRRRESRSCTAFADSGPEAWLGSCRFAD